MTLTYGFYNSVSSDRLYDATHISRIFDGVIEDGVFASIGEVFVVSPVGGLSVSVGTGRAWFDHTWSYNDADVTLTHDAADLFNPRYDTVVLEINSEVATRANTLKIVKGTPSATPVVPTLTNTATIHQYPLAHVYIPVGLTEIAGQHITNKVGSSECPFVTGPLQVVNIDTLLTQWHAEFHAWFDFIVDELSEEQFGNLQNQILAITADKTKRFFVQAHYDPVDGDPSDGFRGKWSDSWGGFFLGNNTQTKFHGSFTVPLDFVGSLVVKPSWGCHAATNQQIVSSSHIKYSQPGDTGTAHQIDLINEILTLPAVDQLWSPTFNLTDASEGDIVHLHTRRDGNNANDTSTEPFNTFEGWIVEYTAEM